MGITIYNSNRMEELADILGEKLRSESAGKGIFFQSQVIVPNKGIARFLTLRFTEKNKIVMGMEFPYLMTFLLRNIGQVAGSVREQGDDAHELCSWDALINTESLTLRIYALLPELLDLPEFYVLKNYIGEDRSPLRRWQLAGKLAALFDRYILYRPDWILHWEKSELPLPELQGHFNMTEKWQRTLWRAVRRDWPENPAHIVHFAHIYRKILSGEWTLTCHDTVRIFGFSTLPSTVLECFEKLNTPVEIYGLTPCEAYWGEAKDRKQELRELIGFWENIRVHGVQKEVEEAFFKSQEELFFQNNPLLGSFAAQGRKYFVRSLDWESESVFPPESEPVTLLEKVQHALRFNEKTPEQTPEFTGKPDDSIQIHNCYSEFREVEALHDYLLSCFAQDSELTFNDVIIMSPVPERYTPFIEAVFHNPANGKNMLRVASAECAAMDKITAMEGFLKLLQLCKGAFEASAVMDILAIPDIHQNFGILPEELSALRQCVCDAGIRWGWDETEHEAHGGQSFCETSWRYGLDRLLLDYAGLEKDEKNNLFRADSAGLDGALLGNFCRFADVLHDTVLWMRERETSPVTVAEWNRFLLERVAIFFGENSVLYSLLRPQLANLRRNAESAGCPEEKFNADIFLDLLQKILESIPENSRGFLRGKITFCNLRPMRSIPGKIICLLGMNHDTFPREAAEDTLDLMRELYRNNDPVAMEDERQLFIEIILAARRALYISYCGHGIRDNKKYPASSCVEELRFYLEEAFGGKSWYDTEEPLQSFDPVLFRPGNPVRSHSQVLCRCAGQLRESASVLPPESDGTFFKLTEVPGDIPEEFFCVSLAELESFFGNPARYFMKKRLNAVPFEENEVQLQDTEPFFLSWSGHGEVLQAYERILATPEEKLPELRQELLTRMRGNGSLPLYSQLNEVWPLWDDSCSLCGNIRRFMGGELRHVKSSSVKIGKFTLLLPAMEFYNGVQLFPLFYKLPGNAYRYALRHLAANLAADGVESMMIGASEAYRLLPVGAENAGKMMAEILSLYESGMRLPLRFFPKTSYNACFGTDELEKTVYNSWEGEYGEKEKFGKYYGNSVPDAEEVLEIAERFYQDLKFEVVGE